MIVWPVSAWPLRSWTFWSLARLVHRILAGGCSRVSRVRVKFRVKVRVRDGCCIGLQCALPKLIWGRLVVNALHPYNSLFSRTTWVSRYQKARYEGWHWYQLDHMQIICTLLQTDNQAITLPLKFLQDGCPSCHPSNSIKALKAAITQ